jgi:glycosyltransferase involved in cell wall biosynthesis
MNRVGIVAVSHPRLGGTYQYTLSMIAALKRVAGNQYTIFTTRDNHCYDDLGIPVVRLPSPGATLRNIVAARLLRLPVEGVFGGIEKIIAPIYTTRLLATRVPFAFTLHDLQERYFPEYFNLARRTWRHGANWALARTASVILCESTHVMQDIHRFLRVEMSRIMMVQAPPVSAFRSEDLDEPSLRKARESLRLPDQFLFYPAQFFAHKNHRRLIESFQIVLRRHPNCHLLLTGQKQHEFERVMQQVNELGLQDRVRHLGYVETGVLAAVYRLATLVVVPTLFESISIPVFESFLIGAPVCASNVVALPEQVGDAGVLFDPYSVEDMAQKICATLDDPGLRSDLAVRGKQRVERLTLDRYAEQLAVVLERIGAVRPGSLQRG